MVNTYWRLLTKSTASVLIKFGTEPPGGKEIVFPLVDNSDVVKKYWWLAKIFFSRSTEPISTKFAAKSYGVKEIPVCSKEMPCIW